MTTGTVLPSAARSEERVAIQRVPKSTLIARRFARNKAAGRRSCDLRAARATRDCGPVHRALALRRSRLQRAQAAAERRALARHRHRRRRHVRSARPRPRPLALDRRDRIARHHRDGGFRRHRDRLLRRLARASRRLDRRHVARDPDLLPARDHGQRRDGHERLALAHGGLTIFGWVGYARILRSIALSLREREYIAAAKFMGVPSLTILRRHMIPNLGSILIIHTVLGVVYAVQAETGLSFLGFGITPPDTSLGVLIRAGSSTLSPRRGCSSSRLRCCSRSASR